MNQAEKEKRDLLEMEYRMMFAAAGRAFPKDPDLFLNVAMEDLGDIPIGQIRQTFKKARQNNENVSPPSNGKLLKTWREMQSTGELAASRRAELVESPGGMMAPKGTYYTILSIPWIYMPEHYKRLLWKKHRNQLNAEEYAQYQTATEQKIYHEDLRLNPTLQAKIDSLPDPDKMVSVARLLDGIGKNKKMRF